MRGKGNDGANCPYSLNLIDQWLSQEEFNGGYAYLNTFVGSHWLTHNMNVEEAPGIAQKFYRESLEYLAELRDGGRAADMHLGEFAAWFREHRPIGKSEVNLAREILYGSGKHYVWYIDPCLGVLVDTAQGGSIGDLRAYIGHVPGATGPDTPRLGMGSYPYLIQSQRRTGMANHSFDGARTTLLVKHNAETVDLARCRAQCADIRTDREGVHVRLTPAQVSFSDGFSAAIETAYHFQVNGSVIIERGIVESSDPETELDLEEYVKGCYGYTEYPEDLRGLTLSVRGKSAAELEYRYQCRTLDTAGAEQVCARIPQVRTELRLAAMDGPAEHGSAAEGFLFNPYYVLTLSKKARSGRSVRTCLSVARIA